MPENIKNLPEQQRPYEKCITQGEAALSDSELLAVILRSGTKGVNSVALADRILEESNHTAHPGLLGLFHMSFSELMSIRGIGEVKAVQLKCIGEISKRMASAAARPGLSFQKPSSIAQYYMERLRHEEQESLYCMMLDNKNHLLAEHLLSRGTANATLISPREVYLKALGHRALSLILVHNHPSGDPSPSEGDRDVTRRISEAGELLGISLLDHIIIGDRRYFSFLEEGLLKQYES